MVSLMKVYDAFLSKVNEDDWTHPYSQEDIEWFIRDWRAFLNSALPYFKFPRCRLDIDEEQQAFVDDRVGQPEIQVIATFMKQEWLKRTVDSWENIKTQYDEADFSQANLLNNFIKLKDQVTKDAATVEFNYYRSPGHKPFNYKQLAGGGVKHDVRRFRR